MSSIFISDLHLHDISSRSTRSLMYLLEGPAREATNLFVLGDLFEYWVGDDTLDQPLHQNVSKSFKTLSEQGTSIYYIHGNRDFLIGNRFLNSAGMVLLDDPTLIELEGRSILLMHGDTLCTKDTQYQEFRTKVRNEGWKEDFLKLPLEQRKQIAKSLRDNSEHHKQKKDMEIMDVDIDTVVDVFRKHNYPTIVHGHTHKPAHHRHKVDGKICNRHVLSDWDTEASYLVIDQKGYKDLKVALP